MLHEPRGTVCGPSMPFAGRDLHLFAFFPYLRQANWAGAKVIYGDTDSVFATWHAFRASFFSSFLLTVPRAGQLSSPCDSLFQRAAAKVQLKGYSLEEAFQTGRKICAEVGSGGAQWKSRV